MKLVGNEQPLSILVVDDDDVDREKILRLLKRVPIRMRITEGASAKDALVLIHKQCFNCAILDYQLKDALGSELFDAIKNSNPSPVPIIMVSGNSDERVVANVMRDGAFDYLSKRNLQAEQLQKALKDGLDWAASEKNIKEQRVRFHELSEGLPQLAWTCQPDGQCDFLNRRWCDFTGIPQQAQLGSEWMNQVHPDDREQIKEAWLKAVNAGEELSINFRIRRYDGEYRWFDTRATPQKDADGKIIRWLGSNTDITEFELTRQALTSSEQRFHAAFDYAPLGMILVSLDGKILQTNTALHQLLEYDIGEIQTNNVLVKKKLAHLIHKDDVKIQQHSLNKLRMEGLPFVQYESRYLTKNGRTTSTLVSASVINKDDDYPCFLLHIYDLSERKRYEEELIKLAHYDPLTGLGNRAKLNDEIEFLIQKSHRNSSSFALLFGDIDHFKQINDGLGHEAGDNLLKIVAKRLKKGLRREDRVARLGGDEFVILLQDVTQFESVVTVAKKLIENVMKPIELGITTVHVGISFGIALFPTDGDKAQTLLRNADSALYDAKAKGRGCYQLYREELTEYVHNRLLLDTDLRNAITKNQFELHFQPVINLKTKKIESVEALIRWNHPTRGRVPPDEFIPYAQETDLINRIGEWVINEACRCAAIWQRKGFDKAIAINVSARQFQQHTLLQIFSAAIEKYQLDPEKVIVEITEQMFLENTSVNLQQISELKAMGLKISLDDFGVGYSSLSYIIRFSPHYLKIDRSFINKIGTAKEHDEMVSTIIGLSKIIPMKIVGEGIEKEEQEKYLHERGCHLAQGYLYSKPVPLNEIIGIFETFESKGDA